VRADRHEPIVVGRGHDQRPGAQYRDQRLEPGLNGRVERRNDGPRAALEQRGAGRTAAGVPSATSGRARPPRGWVVVPMVGPGGAGLTWNMDL